MVDTIAEISRLNLDAGLIARLYHPLAAMPSIHVAFAVVTDAAIRATSVNPLVRHASRLYAPLVAGVVIVTANHYVLDVVAGAALGKAGLAAARWLEP
jgi:hypothetical protein